MFAGKGEQTDLVWRTPDGMQKGQKSENLQLFLRTLQPERCML
jgi:hypothetical protein